MAKKKKSSSGSPISARTLIAGLAVVVAAAAAIAIGSSGGGSSTPKNAAAYPGGVTPAQFQPVKITGAKLAPLPESGADPSVGMVAPSIEGYDSNGRPTVVTPTADGIATMLVFLAHWCPSCNREMPRLMDWYDSGKVPSALRIVGITTGSDNARANWPPSDWLDGFKWPWDRLADTKEAEAALAYGVNAYPYFVLIDSTGKVVKRNAGEVETADLVQMVDATIAVK